MLMLSAETAQGCYSIASPCLPHLQHAIDGASVLYLPVEGIYGLRKGQNKGMAISKKIRLGIDG